MTLIPKDLPPDKNPDFMGRLVVVKKTPSSNPPE